LPADFLNRHPAGLKLYLPMRQESRSLNLSNTVSIVLYEAWKQLGFPGAQAR
jgi:tRNA (cytidine/uridine-2'-O-)-methyltransferase